MKVFKELALFACGLNAMVLCVGALAGDLNLVLLASFSGVLCLGAYGLNKDEK